MARPTRILTGGVHFGEGPRWRDGRLWFSDFWAHAVMSVSLAGDLRTEFAIDDEPSGLGFTPQGDLLVVSMQRRQVLRRAPDGALSVHADLSAVAGWHCNDMVVDSAGRAYVGNFGFDLFTAIAERGMEGVMADHGAAALACVAPDGAVSVAAEGLHFPNGSVITPDGRTLIVAETLAGCLTAFDIDAAGALSGRRVWAALEGCVPDGICLDAEGAIWVADAGGSGCRRVAPGGEVLEIIETSMACAACMLGGEDGRTLFMLCSPVLGPPAAGAEPEGRILVATVDVRHAGLP